MSWIIRQTHIGDHDHGYSAGPVYGYIAQYAQVNEPSSVPFDEDYVEPVGYGAEGPSDDNYDPFGYGEHGYGYGYAQKAYKELQEKIKAMEDA